MIKKILIILIGLFLFNNVYSVVNPNCDYVFLNDNNFNLLLQNNSFNSAVDEISLRMINDNNLTIDENYNLFDDTNGIQLTIRFSSTKVNNGLFGIFFPSTNVIIIYVGNIYDVYKNSTNGINKSLNNIKNTLKHELIHYADLTKTFSNVSNTINLNLSNTSQVLNLQYYIEIFNNGNMIIDIPIELRPSLDYQNLFLSNNSVYEPSEFRSEIVARTFSVCINETSNSVFNYSINNYCNNFNFSDNDLVILNNINSLFLREYLKTKYPQFTSKAKNLNDNCVLARTSQFLPNIGKDISGFLANFSIGIINFILSMGIVGGILVLLSSLFNYLKTLKLK